MWRGEFHLKLPFASLTEFFLYRLTEGFRGRIHGIQNLGGRFTRSAAPYGDHSFAFVAVHETRCIQQVGFVFFGNGHEAVFVGMDELAGQLASLSVQEASATVASLDDETAALTLQRFGGARRSAVLRDLPAKRRAAIEVLLKKKP